MPCFLFHLHYHYHHSLVSYAFGITRSDIFSPAARLFVRHNQIIASEYEQINACSSINDFFRWSHSIIGTKRHCFNVNGKRERRQVSMTVIALDFCAPEKFGVFDLHTRRNTFGQMQDQIAHAQPFSFFTGPWSRSLVNKFFCADLLPHFRVISTQTRIKFTGYRGIKMKFLWPSTVLTAFEWSFFD